jgi:hypothetical protein
MSALKRKKEFENYPEKLIDEYRWILHFSSYRVTLRIFTILVNERDLATT